MLFWRNEIHHNDTQHNDIVWDTLGFIWDTQHKQH
jgi:hypothetical protein